MAVTLSLFEYTTHGPDSGGCSHRHRTRGAAARCLETARRQFRRDGAFCDRRIVEVVPSAPLPEGRGPPIVGTRIPAGRTIQERLLEERVHGEWAMLVGCILLNRTRGVQVERVVWELLDAWPSPRALARAGPDLEELIRPLGLWRRRAENLRSFSAWWARSGWDRRKRWLPATGARLLEARGLGKFAIDAYRIFVLGERDVETDDHALIAALWRLDGGE